MLMHGKMSFTENVPVGARFRPRAFYPDRLHPSATLRLNSVEISLNGDSWDSWDLGDFSLARADTIGYAIQNACIE